MYPNNDYQVLIATKYEYLSILGEFPLGEGAGVKHSPPGGMGDKYDQKIMKIMILENHQGSS